MSNHMFSAVHRFMIAHLLRREAMKIMLSQSVKYNPARQMFFSLNRRKANLLSKTSNCHTRVFLCDFMVILGADFQLIFRNWRSSLSAA